VAGVPPAPRLAPADRVHPAPAGVSQHHPLPGGATSPPPKGPPSPEVDGGVRPTRATGDADADEAVRPSYGRYAGGVGRRGLRRAPSSGGCRGFAAGSGRRIPTAF